MTHSLELRDAAESAAALVRGAHLALWVEGAIFPSEMAFFLASCEIAGITRVIESGRQDGFSTAILGDWAAGGRTVVSIDLELEPERAAACRARLGATPVDLVKGSAYRCFGRASFAYPDTPTAFLVDGPKGWPAISMMSAALTSGTRMIAIHNLEAGLPTRDLFLRLGGPHVFHEAALADGGPQWRALVKEERDFLISKGAVRDLPHSSLGILTLDGTVRQQFAALHGPHYGLHQPRIVRSLYRRGLFAAASKLYGLSSHLLGR